MKSGLVAMVVAMLDMLESGKPLAGSLRLLAQDDQIDPTLGALTHVISQIQGGSQINTVPAHDRLTGNIRTIPAYPNEMVK